MATNTKFWIKVSLLSFIGVYLLTAFVMDNLDASCWNRGTRLVMLWATVFVIWIIGLIKSE